MVHLSRMSEELVLWVSAPFGFVELGDAWCTGSSIMPQKNLDRTRIVAELVRGKSARVIGHLNALLVLMKGQPLAYNRDNQEDKEPLFDTVDTVLDCLRVFAGMLGTLECRRERMRETARLGHTTATDLADYLVRRAVPFRDAHEAVGRAVRKAVEADRDLSELTLDELRAFSPVIESDVFRGAYPRRLGGRAQPPGRHRARAGPGGSRTGAGEAWRPTDRGSADAPRPSARRERAPRSCAVPGLGHGDRHPVLDGNVKRVLCRWPRHRGLAREENDRVHPVGPG